MPTGADDGGNQVGALSYQPVQCLIVVVEGQRFALQRGRVKADVTPLRVDHSGRRGRRVQVPRQQAADRSGAIGGGFLRMRAVGGVGAEQVMETEPAWVRFGDKVRVGEFVE